MLTTVTTVRGLRPDEFLADPKNLYVGRAMWRQGWKESPFRNPFKVGEWDSPVDLFEESLFAALARSEPPPEMLALPRRDFDAFAGMVLRLHRGELHGKTLGCWCGAWKPGGPEIGCHAVVLAKLGNAMEEPA